MDAVQTKSELLERLAGCRQEISELGVERLSLFGSFRRGEAGLDSDIDFLVFFRKGEKIFSNLFNLSQLLQTTLGRDVELVTPESLSPRLRTRILKDVEEVEGPSTLRRPHS